MLSPVGLPSSRLAAPGTGGVVGLLPVEPFTYDDVRKNNVVLLSPSSLRGLDEEIYPMSEFTCFGDTPSSLTSMKRSCKNIPCGSLAVAVP